MQIRCSNIIYEKMQIIQIICKAHKILKFICNLYADYMQIKYTTKICKICKTYLLCMQFM